MRQFYQANIFLTKNLLEEKKEITVFPVLVLANSHTTPRPFTNLNVLGPPVSMEYKCCHNEVYLLIFVLDACR